MNGTRKDELFELKKDLASYNKYLEEGQPAPEGAEVLHDADGKEFYKTTLEGEELETCLKLKQTFYLRRISTILSVFAGLAAAGAALYLLTMMFHSA